MARHVLASEDKVSGPFGNSTQVALSVLMKASRQICAMHCSSATAVPGAKLQAAVTKPMAAQAAKKTVAEYRTLASFKTLAPSGQTRSATVFQLDAMGVLQVTEPGILYS